MTNSELQEQFIRISQLGNTFDIAEGLCAFKKKYKHTDFYKHTHLPIIQAYKLSLLERVGRLIGYVEKIYHAEEIGEYLTNVLNNVDAPAIESFVQKIFSLFDMSAVTTANTEAKELFEQLKTLA